MKNYNFFLSALCFCLAIAPSWARAEDQEHHGGGGLPQFDPTSWPSQIFWMAVFFVILYTIFSKAVLPSIGATIQSRHDFIKGELTKAEELSAEAKILKQSIDAELKKASSDAHHFIKGAETRVKDHAAHTTAAFRTTFEQKMLTAEQNIGAAKAAAMTDMTVLAAQLASSAAEKIAGIPADSSGAESVVKNLSQKSKIAA